MDYIFWLVIGIMLMAIELVIPGGIAGLIGYSVFMWGVFIGLGGTDLALYAVLGITILLVVLLLTFFNHFSRTWIGKLFTLGQRSTAQQGYVSNDVQTDLEGKTGVAQSTLRPAGVARIDDQFVDVVTEGDFIEAGTPIVVVRVVGASDIPTCSGGRQRVARRGDECEGCEEWEECQCAQGEAQRDGFCHGPHPRRSLKVRGLNGR